MASNDETKNLLQNGIIHRQKLSCMDEPITTMSNGGIHQRKDRPPSGAPKIRMKTKIPSPPPDDNHQKQYNLQNFILIWADADLSQSEGDDQNALTQLRTIVDDIKTYTELHECIDFLTTINDMKMFLIVGHTFARQIVPLVHDLPHLHVIYILSCEPSKHEQWIKRWDKVKDVHKDIATIYQSLQQVVKEYSQNSIAMTFLPVNETTSIENLEQLDTSFLYSQIFQQILLGIDYKEEFIKDFILFWRYHYLDNPSMLNIITVFERDYRPDSSIWWYTRCDFVYQMINLAILRSEANIIFYLGCFLKNLNRQIEQLYQKQIKNYHGRSLIVYRGQSLSISDFEKLKKTKDGLVCFNNFLSTNKNKEVAMVTAESALIQTDTIGVLFKISINPSVSSIPFADIHEVSYNRTENEILFSMNSVFRVGSIIEIEENLYEVELELIADDDEKFRDLMEFIEEETEEYAGWKLLDQTSEKTTSIYDTNMCKTGSAEFVVNGNQMKQFQNKLASIYGASSDHKQPISYFEKALEICKRTLPSHHLNFSIIYHNFATVYKNTKEYSKALSFLEKALEIETNILPLCHPDLATLYNNIGVAYSNLKEYSKALTSHGKGMVIYEKILCSTHPQLAHFYDNIAAAYFDMQNYSKSLSAHEKALDMKKRNVPLNQYDLVISYTNIGVTYRHMNEHSKSISYHEKALEIQKKHFSSNYNEMSSTYIDIASAYVQLKDCPKIVLIYEELIEYATKMLHTHHASLAPLYRNLGVAYLSVEKYSEALSCFEKQLDINQKYYPTKHPAMAANYHAMGRAYYYLTKYSQALSFYEKALDIRKQTLPPNDSQLATSYSYIGEVHRCLKDYAKALSFHEKALTIRQAILPANDTDLADSYSNIGEMYQYMGEQLKALSHHEKALEIYKQILSPNDPHLASYYTNVAVVHQTMGMDSKAIPLQEKAITIMENSRPINESVLAALYHQISSTYDNVGDYWKARTTKKKLRELIERSPSLKSMAIITNGNQTTGKNNIDKSFFRSILMKKPSKK